MNVYIDYEKRLARIRETMVKQNVDLLLGTRTVSVTYASGAFVPWRSAMLISKDGLATLITFMIDDVRVKNESWLSEVIGYAPIPGMDMLDVAVHLIKASGLEKARIGVELGHSPRGNTGYLFATEYDYLKEALPEAKFVNALGVIDRASYVKDPAEIQLMRQAAAMADAALDAVKDNLRVGMTETELAGLGEYELRRLGSEYHWAVTGSTEVASGPRASYPMTGTTPPSRKIIQKGETVIADFHPCYRTYLSDLSHNFIIGRPSPEQQKLADAYLWAADAIVSNMKAGRTVGETWRAVQDQIESSGFSQYTIPFYGHGLGVMGHEWYPGIGDSDEFRNVVWEENVVEVAFLSITVPGVGGMRLEYPVRVTADGGEPLAKTPLALTVLDE